MKQAEIIPILAAELGLPEALVKNTIAGFYKCIRHQISHLPLKEDLTEEEFRKLKTSYNIPSIGKLFITYDRYTKKRESYKKAVELKNRQNAEHKED